MEDFNLKKREYLEKLRMDPRYRQALLNDKTNDSRSLEIVFDPKTENELILAESIYTIFSDVIYIFDNSYLLEESDLDSVEIVNFLSEIIIALKNNDQNRLMELKDILKNKLSPEFIGKMTFQMMKETVFDGERLFMHLSTKCGFDPEDELSLEQFTVYLNRATEELNKSNLNFSNSVYELTDERIELLNRFMFGFHEEFQKTIARKKGK